MGNKYLEKIAMNRITRYALDKTLPILEETFKHAPKEVRAKGIAAFKNSVKTSVREGTGGPPSTRTSTFKDSFK